MFFFGSKKPTSQNHLVISVESSHVRACFVLLQENEKPYIVEQHIQTVSGDQYRIENITQTLNQVLEQLIKKNPLTIDKVVCVFSSPWYAPHMDTYIRDEETPFVFREKDAKQILKKTVADFEELHKTRGDFQILEQKILHIGINGYEIFNFKKEKARRVEVSSYVSLVASHAIKKLQETIERHVRKDISFHTSMFVQSVVGRDVFQYLDNFLLVSIEGLFSEVTIVHHGALAHGEVISSGEGLIFDNHKDTNLPHPDIILSEFTSSHKGMLTNTVQKKHPIIANAEEEWRRQFVQSLSEVTRNIPLPNQCVVVAKDTTFLWIKNALEDPRNKHLSVSDTNLHAILMNAESLHSFVGSKIPQPDFKLMIYTAFTSLKVL